MSAKWGRKSVILFYASVRGLPLKREKLAYVRIVPSKSPNVAAKVLIIEINRLVNRAFDVAGRESSSRYGDSSGDENIL